MNYYIKAIESIKIFANIKIPLKNRVKLSALFNNRL